MSTVKIMIVDDSPFSRTILADELTECGYEVVGEADSIDNLIEVYQQSKPDVVTMDIAMPVADGFECSRKLLSHDPDAKILLISSMKDESTETEARKIGIIGYIQKPADQETLKRIIDNILSPDKLYLKIQRLCKDIFKEALSQTITRFTKTTAEFEDKSWDDNQASDGIAVVIGIIGLFPGTFILDISPDTAEKLAEKMLRRPVRGREEVVAMAAELANVVGGIACSMINKRDKSLRLMVAPPSVFYGETTEIANPNVNVIGITAQTEFGAINTCIGIKKGAVLWM